MKWAQPEQLEAVRVDGVPAAARDLVDHRLKAAVLHFDGPAAAPTDDMMVVLLRRTRDVRVLAAGQVEAFERAELGEKLQVSEQRRPTDPHPPSLGVSEEVRRREVVYAIPNELSDRAARPGQPIAGVTYGIYNGR